MQGIKAMLSRRVLVVLAASMLGLLGSAGAASAATFTVNDPGDFPQNPAGGTGNCVSTHGGTCTLRAAVQAADETGGANTINLPAGTYTFSSAQNPGNSPGCKASSPPSPCDPNDPAFGDLDIQNGAAVTVLGGGSGSTIIDTQGIDRAFAVQIGGALTLQGLTIENGFPDSRSTRASCGNNAGGAIYSNGALATTGDVVFSGNGSDRCGGAIVSDNDPGSTVSIAGTSFLSNTVFSCCNGGGAIYDHSPHTMSVSTSTFTGNSSIEEGGAIDDEGSDLRIDSSTFSQNSSRFGGAVYNDATGVLTVTSSTFSQNGAANEGSAFEDDRSSGATFSNDRFVGNSGAAGDGGTLYLDSPTSGAHYTVSQDEFDNNSSSLKGGGIVWYRAPLFINGSSFVGNNGAYNGGALWADCSSCSLTIVNSTLSKNSAVTGGGIDLANTTEVAWVNDTIAFNGANGSGSNGGGVFGTANADVASYTPPAGTSFTAGIENTIIGSNTGGDCNATFNPAVEPNGHNLDSDKSCFTNTAAGDIIGRDPGLSQPADNGGPSAGDPANDPTTLLTDSDMHGPAVDAGTNTGCPSTDERGVPRPQGSACDIGAYESAAAGLSLTKTAPASAAAGSAFNYTITASNGGPGFSTGTTVTDTLPTGETLFGATPSQGTCSTAGSTVTCSLGNIASGSNATIALVVSDSTPGTVTNTANASNDEGASVSASASTTITRVSSQAGPPTAITGPVSARHNRSATLTGQVLTGGQPTGYFFQYGTTGHFGLITPVLHTGNANQSVSAVITGLTPGTVYHYRLVAINDTGSSFGATRTFKTTGSNFLGSLQLVGRTLTIKNGMVFTRFRCASSKACFGLYSITIRVRVAKTHRLATIDCTKSRFAKYTIGAHKTRTVSTPVHDSCTATIKLHGGRYAAKVTTRPRTAQKGLVKQVTLVVR